MAKTALLMCICACALVAQEVSEQHSAPKGKKLWMWSLVALAAGNAADVQSSWGAPEANRLLAGPQGQFGWRSFGIKLGLQAPLIGLELWHAHKHPSERAYKAYSVTNFAVGAGFGAAALHNQLR